MGNDFDPSQLFHAIKKMIQKGCTTFLNGLAVGFDLLAAEYLLAFKSKYPQIKLITCIPCKEQEKYYSDDDKIRYLNVLLCADERKVLSKRYHRGCMLARDRYMVEQGNCMITYCKRDTGGTAYTLRYFQKKHPEGEIIYL